MNQLVKIQYFKTWMTRILINKCYDIRKKNQNLICLDQYEEPAAYQKLVDGVVSPVLRIIKTAQKMPLEYKIDKEMLRLIAEANVKYGEYKSLLNTLEFDARFFLDSIILNESYKSTQIEGTQISQDEMYYLKYMKKTDDNQEIQNLKRTIEYAGAYLKSGKQICYELVNEMHKIILDSVRGSQKTPGKIRTIQNWIGPRGCTMESATFIPPIPEEVYGLLMNLYEYMNDEFTIYITFYR